MKIDTPNVDWLTLSPELSLLAAAGRGLLGARGGPAPRRRRGGAVFAVAG